MVLIRSGHERDPSPRRLRRVSQSRGGPRNDPSASATSAGPRAARLCSSSRSSRPCASVRVACRAGWTSPYSGGAERHAPVERPRRPGRDPEDAVSAANHVRAATGVAAAGLPSVALHLG